jgi:hypothetical protein
LRQAAPRLTRAPGNGKVAKPYSLNWSEQDRPLRALPHQLQGMVLCEVNTGCIEQEVCKLRWDWEVKVPEFNTSVFIIPARMVKNREERLVVLNSIAAKVIDRMKKASYMAFVTGCF